MINTNFKLSDWNKESIVQVSYKTPYDAYIEGMTIERVKDFVDAIRFIRGRSSRPVSKVRFELQALIQSMGFQDKIQVGRDPIGFLYEVYGFSSLIEFQSIIKDFKSTISRMDPADDHKKCRECQNVLLITGREQWHDSTSIFYFCLNCGGIFELYRDKDNEYTKRIYRLKRRWLIA